MFYNIDTWPQTTIWIRTSGSFQSSLNWEKEVKRQTFSPSFYFLLMSHFLVTFLSPWLPTLKCKCRKVSALRLAKISLRPVYWTSKSDLSSVTKCDPNKSNHCCDLSLTLLCYSSPTWMFKNWSLRYQLKLYLPWLLERNDH